MAKKATIVVGLKWGDEGKGTEVDFQCRQGATTVIRFNGGPQAGHNVVDPQKGHHCFQSFGSGMFVEGVKTYLSEYVLISPLRMLDEAKKLEALGVFEPMNRMYINQGCMVITPYHEAANRLRELARGVNRHGSCGMGIGEVMADAAILQEEMLVANDLNNAEVMYHKLERIRALKRHQLIYSYSILKDVEEAQEDIAMLQDTSFSYDVVQTYVSFAKVAKIVPSAYLGGILLSDSHVVFEGAQGVLLDQWYGFPPYNTWSTTTTENALQLLKSWRYTGEVIRLGCLRAYETRHGAGPLPTEDAELTKLLQESANPFNPWQEGFRVGYFDAISLRYSLSVCPVDGLVISNFDRLYGMTNLKFCNWYANDDDPENITNVIPIQDDKYNLKMQAGITDILMRDKAVYYNAFNNDRNPFTEADIKRYCKWINIMCTSIPIVCVGVGPTCEHRKSLEEL